MARKRRPLGERFWEKVDCSAGVNACWPWTASKIHNGYGQFMVERGQQPVRAHRFAWGWAFGPVPAGMWVLHRCDNPGCCNPFVCLWLGTHADNDADRIAKGRSRGATPRYLSETEVEQIIARYAAGDISQDALGREFGMSRWLVGEIIQGRRTASA